MYIGTYAMHKDHTQTKMMCGMFPTIIPIMNVAVCYLYYYLTIIVNARNNSYANSRKIL